MIRVGMIGLGSMGKTHLEAYAKHADVRIVALSDRDPDRLAGRAAVQGNIPGQARGNASEIDARRYPDGLALIADEEIDLVDLCVWTPLHHPYAIASLRARKHVLIEKPLALSSHDAHAIADAARASDRIAMCAMCMRFWPGWTWLADAVADRRYGRVLAAHFRRVCSRPKGAFYADEKLSGGALFDLHVHDTDFVHHCFGAPAAVSSRGYSRSSSSIDHVMTHYLYEGADSPALVTAEGGWAMADGFPFVMQYTVNFEEATATFDARAKAPLVLHARGRAEEVPIDAGLGYEHEIAYFLDCIRKGEQPSIVTLDSAARSLAILEAEAESVASGLAVRIGS